MNMEDNSLSAVVNEHQRYSALSSCSHNSFYGSLRHTVWVISPAVTTPVGIKGQPTTPGSRWSKGHFRAGGKTSEQISTVCISSQIIALTGLLSLIIFSSVSFSLTSYSDTIDYVKEQ